MKTKKTNKRAYLDDFILNEQGQYEYKGIIYKIQNTDFELKSLIIMLVLSFVCIIAGGIIPFSGSMHAFYIIMPYIVEIVLFGLLSYAFFEFCTHYKELREYIYKKSYEKFKPYTSILIGNMGLSVICTLVYSVFNGFEVWAIVYVGLHVIAFILIRKFSADMNELKFDKISLK